MFKNAVNPSKRELKIGGTTVVPDKRHISLNPVINDMGTDAVAAVALGGANK